MKKPIMKSISALKDANKDIAMLIGAIELELAVGREIGTFSDVLSATLDLSARASDLVTEASRIDNLIKAEERRRESLRPS